MIRIDNVLAPSEEMIQTVIRGMRNPYNSWDKSDHGGEKDHKLDEWHTFCDWIKSLPNSDLIV